MTADYEMMQFGNKHKRRGSGRKRRCSSKPKMAMRIHHSKTHPVSLKAAWRKVNRTCFKKKRSHRRR